MFNLISNLNSFSNKTNIFRYLNISIILYYLIFIGNLNTNIKYKINWNKFNKLLLELGNTIYFYLKNITYYLNFRFIISTILSINIVYSL